MARPVKRRRICELPQNREFLPTQPAKASQAEFVTMTVDEFEALRLIDHIGLEQEACARQMGVARTTVQAIYTAARKKVAEALVCGRGLKINGGNYELCPENDRCCGSHCPGGGCAGRRCAAGRSCALCKNGAEEKT